MIGKTLGHFEILSALGKGGMGEVYRARDTKLDRDVALKTLPRELSDDRERAARFEREARTLASLQHPNIASIYGYEEVDGVRFLAMELVEGEDLATRLARGAATIDEAIAIAQQVATGLEAAHERGIVHRDLKPANVMLAADGGVKILDFGLARAISGDTDDGDPSVSPTITAAMTVAGTILGTAAYMSPEQARGRNVDKRADIWAFGVMFTEMFTGERLYAGETVTDVLGAIVHGTPDLDGLPAKVPPSIRHLIARCLTPDVKERLRDIGEARIVLAQPQAPATAAATASPTVSPLRAALLALLPAALILAGAWFLWPAPPAEPDVLHASILPAENQNISTMGLRGGSIRLSPDGRMVAYVGQDDAGRRIWVRELGARNPRAIAGTEGGHRPFWSPDGRSIGFFVEDAMRRVDVAGGAPLTVTAAPNGRGGTWLENGLIVYAPTPNSRLFAVPAGGGTPHPVTRVTLLGHREPRRLPGTDRFLFLEQVSGSKWFVNAGSTSDSTHVRIVESGAGAEYADGHLFYLRNQTLVAQPLDLDTMELGGEPTPLAENVFRDTDYGIGAFSAVTGGTLAYLANSQVGRSLKWYDRDGKIVAEHPERIEYNEIRLSPDGTTIAATINNLTGGSDIWLIDVASDTRRRLVFASDDGVKRRASLIWSPDGSFLVYSTEFEGATRIFRKSTDNTRAEEEVARVPGVSLWPYDISPDGRWIVVGRQDGGGSENFWVFPLDGDGEMRPIYQSPNDDWPARVSPDGRWLAFDSNETGRREIYVVPFPEGTGRWQVSNGGGRFPEWNGEGTELFYASSTGEIMSVPIAAGEERFAAGDPVALFRAGASSGFFGFYAAHPSGDRFVVQDDVGDGVPISLFMNWQQALRKD